MSRAGLDKDPRAVASMFDQVADRYDLTNDVLSLGQDRRWRRAVVDLVDPQPGERILDLADDSFDAVTISFGLRNIHDPVEGLRELLRVTRPGGRVVVCEFSTPTWAPFRGIYVNYLMRALPPVARAVSSNPDSYVYLAESIRAWPDQKGLALRFVEAGWGRVEWHNLSGGIVALHHSVKPG